jgi:hypothetical protein
LAAQRLTIAFDPPTPPELFFSGVETCLLNRTPRGLSPSERSPLGVLLKRRVNARKKKI